MKKVKPWLVSFYFTMLTSVFSPSTSMSLLFYSHIHIQQLSFREISSHGPKQPLLLLIKHMTMFLSLLLIGHCTVSLVIISPLSLFKIGSGTFTRLSSQSIFWPMVVLVLQMLGSWVKLWSTIFLMISNARVSLLMQCSLRVEYKSEKMSGLENNKGWLSVGHIFQWHNNWNECPELYSCISRMKTY